MPALRSHVSSAGRARQFAFVVLVVLAVAALVGCGGSSTDGAATAPSNATTGATAVVLASPEEAQAVIDGGDVTVLDVRTPEEFAEGHLVDAENVDFNATDFADRVDTLDRGDRYVVYCQSGNRSGQATELMAQMGFTTVTDVDGGIVAWKAADLPTVTAG